MCERYLDPDSVPDPGSNFVPLDPDPGSKMKKNQDPGSWISISDHISESSLIMFLVKILKFFVEFSVVSGFGIRDG
jgi:hypothetical protein